ncbi:MAG: ABC transporter substrate-binding protein [Pseudomonadota bacterium]
MTLDRRSVMSLGIGGAALLAVGPAFALTEDEARRHVEGTITELLGLLKDTTSVGAIAPKLRAIMETRSNMPQIARFSAGRVWLDMSDAQRSRYTDAFAHFVSVVYARQFVGFTGNPNIQISKILDAGRKGFLVQTPLISPSGTPLSVEWLISDRGGKVEVVDIVVEGISMAVTQREEIAAMFESRGGDIEQLIATLKGEQAG